MAVFVQVPLSLFLQSQRAPPQEIAGSFQDGERLPITVEQAIQVQGRGAE